MNDKNAATFEYLRKLADARFYGTITIKFEHGRVVHLRREENLKPEELSGQPRYENGTNHS